METAIIELAVFLAFFFAALFAGSCVDFAKFCILKNRQKFYLLYFMLCMAIAWLCTDCVLSLTIYRGW